MGAPVGNRNAAGKRSSFAIQNISEGLRRSWQNPAIRERYRLSRTGLVQTQEHISRRTAPLVGRPLSVEHRALVSEALRGHKKRPETIAKLRLATLRLGDEWKRKLSKAKIKEWNSGLRKPRWSGTLGEKALAKLLESLNVEYVVQSIVPGVRGVWDFEIPSAHLLIEVDGEWLHKEPVQIRRDSAKTLSAWKAGYSVLRFWRSEVLEESDSILTRLEASLC